MNPNTSATVTSTGSLPTTVKNTLKSYAVAHNVLPPPAGPHHLQIVIHQPVTEHDLPAASDG